MYSLALDSLNDLSEWRDKARRALLAGILPADIRWLEPGNSLLAFETAPLPSPSEDERFTVNRAFLELADKAICHRDPSRFDLLYRCLWRLRRDPQLMSVQSDPDLHRLSRLASAVRRDSHKMKAFVRFRELADGERKAHRFIAWFEPEHYVLERTAPFFSRRFAAMDWAIVTPYRSVRWDGAALTFGPGGTRADVPADDAMEQAWRTYYASIFNPARLKVAMMKSEMPVKYWRNLPEAELIPELVRGARAAEQDMLARQASQPPSRHIIMTSRQQHDRADDDPGEAMAIASLDVLSARLEECRRCPLFEHATQAVPGEGPKRSALMLVGEQPGDHEDLTGRPFVGPADTVLDEALAGAGIDRDHVYVTNAVKHFKFRPQGKRRLHEKPDRLETMACKFWLDHEIALVKPQVIVALGATAAMSLLGHAVKIGEARGKVLDLPGSQVRLVVTNHPSYILRIPDRTRAAEEREKFRADLAFAAGLIAAA